MELLYTEEERLLRSTVRAFAERELAPLAARWDENEEFPWESLTALKQMDLMGASVPSAYGGQGMSSAELCIIHEEIARACMSTSTTYLTHLSLSSEALVRFGSPEQKQRYLPAMATGNSLGAFALTEPSSGSDASDMQTSAVRKGDGYLLNGAKIFITNGHEADVMVVFTSTDRSQGARGTTAFIVERAAGGFETVPMHGKMGIRGSGTAHVYFNDCRVPAGQRLGEEGQGFKVAMSIIDSSRISIAAQAVGLAAAACEAAVRYVQQRATFGKRLAEHQAVQFMLADMATQLEAARLLTRSAAQLKDAGHAYAKESAMAKLYASEAAHFCVDKALQIFGGYGYFKENPVERMYRDQRITEIYEGTSEVQRIVIARSLLREMAV